MVKHGPVRPTHRADCTISSICFPPTRNDVMPNGFGRYCGVLLLGFLTPTAFSQALDEQQAWEVIKSRLEAVQNLTVNFQLETNNSPPPEVVAELEKHAEELLKSLPGEGKSIKIAQGVIKTERDFRFLNGDARYEYRLANESAAAADPSDIEHQVDAYSHGRTEKLWTAVQDGRDHGLISEPQPLPFDSLIDVALGLRGHEEHAFLTSSDVDGFSIQLAGPDMFKATRERTDKKTRDVWTFQRDAGWAMTRYQYYAGNFLIVEIKNSDFRTIGNVSLPFESSMHKMSRVKEKSHEVQSKRMMVDEYIPNDPENTAENMLTTWPLRTVVLDSRIDENFVIKSGARTLTDEAIEEATVRPETPGGSTGIGRLMFVLLNVIVFAVLAVVVIRRRRGASVPSHAA